MNDERREYINQRVNESFKADKERSENQKKQTIKQIEDRIDGQRKASDDNLLCACTGLACEGVCRETHLHRPRFANPMVKTNAAKDYVGKKSWTKRCPEAYEN